MIDYLRKLFSFFDRATRWQIAGLFALMISGAGLEFIGIAMVFPLIQFAIDPTSIPFATKLQTTLGIDSARNFLLILGGAIFVFFAAKNLALVAITYLQNRLVNSKQADFASQLFRAYLQRPYVDHIGQNSAEIVRNITLSIPAMFLNGLLALLTLFMEGMLIIAVGTVLMLLEPIGTIVAGGVLAIAMGTLYAATRHKLTAWSTGNKEGGAIMIRAINEGMAAFKEIRVQNRESRFAAFFDLPNRQCADYRTRLAVIGQLPRFVGEIAVMGTIIAAIAAILLVQDRSPADAIPVLGAFAVAALRILPSVNRIVVSASAVRQSLPMVEDLYRDYHAIAPHLNQTADKEVGSFANELRVENVSYTYPGAAMPALRDVSLMVRRGEIVAFAGASGAGKTTLADILLGLIKPDSGRVTIDGRDIGHGTPARMRRFGYIPQHVVLLDASIRDNIAFGLLPEHIDESKVIEAARKAQIAEFIESLPQGYDTVVGEHGARLSGGQRQRVAIARALYDDPEILVMDEVTSALDVETEREFVKSIRELAECKTILVIAHRISTVRACSRVVLINNGRIVDSGTFEELLARNPDFRRMVNFAENHAGAILEDADQARQTASTVNSEGAESDAV